MAELRRGSTPTVRVRVRQDMEGYTCFLSFGKGGRASFTCDNSQMELVHCDDCDLLVFTLTQEQTLKCRKGVTWMQLRVVKDGIAMVSDMHEVSVMDVIQRGVIIDEY